MKINGAYKFRTKAVVDPFISLYLKIEFFTGNQKISANEFVGLVTNGLITDFTALNVGGVLLESGLNLSHEAVVTLIAVNGKGRVVYKREFPNYLQYSKYARGGTAFVSDAFICEYIFASFNAYVEMNSDKTFSIYGLISPGGHFYNSYPYTTGFTIYGYYRRVFHEESHYYMPAFSFKNYEPLVEIGEFTSVVGGLIGAPVSLSGSSLIRDFIYIGAGTWVSQWSVTRDNGFYSGYLASSCCHIYPETQVTSPSGFPLFYKDNTNNTTEYTVSSTYFIDKDKQYPISFLFPQGQHNSPIYLPIIKDSKTNELLFAGTDNSTGTVVYTFKENTLLPFDYSINLQSDVGFNYDLLPCARAYWNKPIFFLFNNNLYTGDIFYNSIKNKIDICFYKNKRESIHSNLSIYNPLDPFLVNKVPQKYEYEIESSGLYLDFVSAMLENYPDGVFTTPYLNNSTSRIQSEMSCYSANTKTIWKFCNAVFVPDTIEWENID